MSNKIVNLRNVRKDRERVEKRARGDANAVKFGRTKAQKETEAKVEAKARADWEAHKRDDT